MMKNYLSCLSQLQKSPDIYRVIHPFSCASTFFCLRVKISCCYNLAPLCNRHKGSNEDSTTISVLLQPSIFSASWVAADIFTASWIPWTLVQSSGSRFPHRPHEGADFFYVSRRSIRMLEPANYVQMSMNSSSD
jgi:hypothetical protein